jgi:hypothetical protein
MPYEFFAVPAKDAQAASTELNQFCASHSVVAIDKQFMVDSDNSYRAFRVNWVNSFLHMLFISRPMTLYRH